MLSYLIGLIKYIPFLLGIGLIIFVHELGHYIAARIVNVDVEVLAYGYGPKLFSIKGNRTEFRFCCIPFGGYCRLKGSIDLIKALKDQSKTISVTEAGSYFSITPFSRFFIYLAGPLMNFILAALLIVISALIPVERISNEAYVAPAANYENLFKDVPMQNDILEGDYVQRSNDTFFKDYQDLEFFLKKNNGEDIPLTIIRDGIELDIILHSLEYDSGYTFGITNIQFPIIGRSESDEYLPGDKIISANGISIDSTLDLYNLDTPNLELKIERNNQILERRIIDGRLPFAWESNIRKYSNIENPISYGVKKSAELFVSTIHSLGALLSFQIKDAREVITGPMNAADSFDKISTIAFNTSTSSGTRTLIYLLALVSISICVGNILPIPTFDGGQMLITVIELINNKPLKPKSYLKFQAIGLVLCYLIVISMYAFDIKRIIFR